MLALPKRALESGELILERELKHSGVGPKAQTGARPTQISARSCARNPTLQDFLKESRTFDVLTYHWVDFRKCPKSSVCTYHNMDFRENAKHLMCDLTTKWILESAQSLACALIY